MRINKIGKIMEEVKAVYAAYPDSPKGLQDWKARLVPIYNAAKKA